MNKFQYIKEFGLNIFTVKSLRRIFLKSNSDFAWKLNDVNESLIEKFLIKNVEKSKSMNMEINLKPLKNNVPEEPVWVMWYQGLEEAPDIVKCCVESIKEHSVGHQVIILTKYNLWDYIKLPDFIMDKFSRGYISRTHLSDMVRLNLLYLYGGAWLDATLLVSNDIPQEYFQQELFSLNFGKKTKDPSHGRWTTFCFFAKKGNTLIEETLKYHYYYWAQQNFPVDYVMFDYFINFIAKHNKTAEKQIADIKPTNASVFLLVDYLNEPYKDYKIFLADNKIIFSKLSWKRQYVTSVQGNQTIYGYLFQKYLQVQEKHLKNKGEQLWN